MAFFTWKDSFNIGLKEVDQQHRSLLTCLNRCHEQVSGDRRAELAPELLDELVRYADTHFQYEESLMRAASYPRMEQHLQQHRYFESQITEYVSEREGGTGKTAGSLLLFLRDWFLEHILEEDRGFVAHVK